MATERARQKTVVGTVISDKMDKTITVRRERMVKHPLYGKYVRRSTRYRAHDEHGKAAEGDTVEIVSTRPYSKTKHWRLLRVVRRAGERHAATTSAAAAPVSDGATTQPAPTAAADPTQVPAPATPEPAPEAAGLGLLDAVVEEESSS